MQKTVPKIRFDKSGYYFIILLALAFAGFWRSYFNQFFSGTNTYNFYFHFHAVMMVLWVSILIAQPLLIRKKKLNIHRIIGKITYVLMPVMLLSVLLVMNSSMKAVPENQITFATVIFPVRDFFLLLVFFTIGLIYRRNVQVHARAMIITGIVFIEPALFRFIGSGFGIPVIIALLVTLIIMERKQKSGRWLFPAFLMVDVAVYLMLALQLSLSFLDPVVKWFAKLPLT